MQSETAAPTVFGFGLYFTCHEVWSDKPCPTSDKSCPTLGHEEEEAESESVAAEKKKQKSQKQEIGRGGRTRIRLKGEGRRDCRFGIANCKLQGAVVRGEGRKKAGTAPGINGKHLAKGRRRKDNQL
jgi:hypothetical protein